MPKPPPENVRPYRRSSGPCGTDMRTVELARRCGPECAEMHTYSGLCELATRL